MLNIKDAETDRLARRLARLSGESITKAVRTRCRNAWNARSDNATGRRSSI